MSRLRIGVIGVGHLGQHHARILAAMQDVELVAVVDSRAEQAQAVAAKCGAMPLTGFEPLLDRVDAVTIAVPTFLHRQVAAPFLDRGVSTLIEKPIAGSLTDAEFLVECARKAGAVLQVGHIEQFNPALQALDRLPIRARYISAERLSTYTFRSTDIGVVYDLMIHDIDLVLSFIKAPVRSVSAVGVCLFGENEDVANARVEFDDGSVANLTASRASYAAIRKMRIWGAEGYASLDFAAKSATLVHPSEQLKNGRLELEGVDLTRPAAVKEHLFGKVLRVNHVSTDTEGSSDSLTLELENFVAAARGLERPRVTGEDALRAMRLAAQVVQSLETHRWGPELATATAAADGLPAFQGPHVWWLNSLRRNTSGAGNSAESSTRLQKHA
jgi:predicted dehydrogenase